MEQPIQEEVATKLYEALLQMRHSRGIHVDDSDIVLGAMEHYEKMHGINPNTKMWRVTFHKSDKPYWIATCNQCDVGQVKLPMASSARRWCRQHECEPILQRHEGEPIDAAHEG